VRYLYYPGCSLKCSGRAYEESLLPVFEAAGIALEELPDWNCCGATAYMSVDELKAAHLALRNLALAEQCANGAGDPVHVVAPCAACYLALVKVQHNLADYPATADRLRKDLAGVGLDYTGRVRVRHPLDVLVNDVGLDRLRSLVARPLSDMRVACYYGCQLVRPYPEFDDPDRPTTMDRLMLAMGTRTVEWPLKTRCCGGTLTGTIQGIGARLNELLAEEAAVRGANVIATACPLCQFNLDCHQKRSTRREAGIPILYFTQVMGLALGFPPRRIGLRRQMVPLDPALAGAAGGSRD
jgi:heterodisulfide reductase subunit B